MASFDRFLNGSIYEMVSNMNMVFGNTPYLTHGDPILFQTLYNQCANIEDEIDELEEALENNDKVEVIDAVGDILTFAFGADHFVNGRMGLSGMEYDNPEVTALDMSPEDYQSGIQGLRDLHELIMSSINEMTVLNFELLLERAGYDLRNLCETVVTDFFPNDVNLNDVMHEVTRSNFSKVCIGEEERDLTIEFYEGKDIEVYTRKNMFDVGFNYYVVYSKKEQKGKDNKMYRENKFLKCRPRFFSPNLEQFAE